MALHKALKTSPHRPYQLDAQHYVITKAPTPTMDGPNKLQQYEDKKKKFFYVEGIHTISTLNTTKKHRITPAKSLGALRSTFQNALAPNYRELTGIVGELLNMCRSAGT